MSKNKVRTRDDDIVLNRPSESEVKIKTPEGKQLTISEGDTVSGTGDHYFEGEVSDIRRSNSTLGHEHYWVTFTDVSLADSHHDEHTLPLGELADQLDRDLQLTK